MAIPQNHTTCGLLGAPVPVGLYSVPCARHTSDTLESLVRVSDCIRREHGSRDSVGCDRAKTGFSSVYRVRTMLPVHPTFDDGIGSFRRKIGDANGTIGRVNCREQAYCWQHT